MQILKAEFLPLRLKIVNSTLAVNWHWCVKWPFSSLRKSLKRHLSHTVLSAVASVGSTRLRKVPTLNYGVYYDWEKKKHLFCHLKSTECGESKCVLSQFAPVLPPDCPHVFHLFLPVTCGFKPASCYPPRRLVCKCLVSPHLPHLRVWMSPIRDKAVFVTGVLFNRPRTAPPGCISSRSLTVHAGPGLAAASVASEKWLWTINAVFPHSTSQSWINVMCHRFVVQVFPVSLVRWWN